MHVVPNLNKNLWGIRVVAIDMACLDQIVADGNESLQILPAVAGCPNTSNPYPEESDPAFGKSLQARDDMDLDILPPC